MSRATSLLLVLWLALAVCPAPLRADDVTTARDKLLANYSVQLAELANKLADQPQAAAELRAWLPERSPDKLTLFLLPMAPVAAGDEKQSWRDDWQTLRNQQAEALVTLASRALVEHQPSLAWELVTEAVRENPDHKLGRKILGYVRFRDGWHTPFEIRQLSANKVWHDQFGWLPKAHLERYEKGQRYYSGRWVSASEEATLRADIKRGWRVESEHYLVTTNHSLEQGVILSRRLEMLYSVWQQVFAGYLASEADLSKRLDGRTARRESRQHNVVCFRTQDEYNRALRQIQPNIETSIGVYFANQRTAYFFAGEKQDPGTVFHEATHQLFQETRATVDEVGKQQNYWVTEAVACYMETLAEHPGYCTLGGISAGRGPAARNRLLEDGFYVPLLELVQLGIADLQRDVRIRQIYSQCAGLADFLMHGQQGRYREPLVQYLDAVYTGRDTVQTMRESLRVGYDTLDREYREYMSSSTPPTAAADARTSGRE